MVSCRSLADVTAFPPDGTKTSSQPVRGIAILAPLAAPLRRGSDVVPPAPQPHQGAGRIARAVDVGAADPGLRDTHPRVPGRKPAAPAEHGVEQAREVEVAAAEALPWELAGVELQATMQV